MKKRLRDPNVRAALIAAMQRGRDKPNKPEEKLGRLLHKLFPGEFRLNVKQGMVIGGKVPDFVNVNGHKVLVELFGTYWHGPKRTGQSNQMAERSRKTLFKKWGFDTVVVWEHELKNNPESVVTKLNQAMRHHL
jgi:very-short-patch-repair endonuclease